MITLSQKRFKRIHPRNGGGFVCKRVFGVDNGVAVHFAEKHIEGRKHGLVRQHANGSRHIQVAALFVQTVFAVDFCVLTEPLRSYSAFRSKTTTYRNYASHR